MTELPEPYAIEYARRQPDDRKERLEREMTYLAYSIRLKVEDLEHTKELHREAGRKLLGLNRAMPDMEREG